MTPTPTLVSQVGQGGMRSLLPKVVWTLASSKLELTVSQKQQYVLSRPRSWPRHKPLTIVCNYKGRQPGEPVPLGTGPHDSIVTAELSFSRACGRMNSRIRFHLFLGVGKPRSGIRVPMPQPCCVRILWDIQRNGAQQARLQDRNRTIRLACG